MRNKLVGLTFDIENKTFWINKYLRQVNILCKQKPNPEIQTFQKNLKIIQRLKESFILESANRWAAITFQIITSSGLTKLRITQVPLTGCKVFHWA